jgi:hypothetical protein
VYSSPFKQAMQCAKPLLSFTHVDTLHESVLDCRTIHSSEEHMCCNDQTMRRHCCPLSKLTQDTEVPALGAGTLQGPQLQRPCALHSQHQSQHHCCDTDATLGHTSGTALSPRWARGDPLDLLLPAPGGLQLLRQAP